VLRLQVRQGKSARRDTPQPLNDANGLNGMMNRRLSGRWQAPSPPTLVEEETEDGHIFLRLKDGTRITPGLGVCPTSRVEVALVRRSRRPI
jgi:hypothetical protein